MIDTNAPILLEPGQQSYAHWAIKKPRRSLDLSAWAAEAIIRIRPMVLVHVCLLICAASGAGIFLAASYALREAV